MRRLQNVLLILLILALAALPVITHINLVNTGQERNGPIGWDEETELLAKQLCSQCVSDEEKVMSIYNWISQNIEYDDNYDAVYQYFDAERTLSSHKGICFDFSNLFAVMCRSQEIQCYIIDGYKKTDVAAKHTWNRVCFNGIWWNVDLSYDAICLTEGKKTYGFNNIGSKHDIPDEDYIITRIY